MYMSDQLDQHGEVGKSGDGAELLRDNRRYAIVAGCRCVRWTCQFEVKDMPSSARMGVFLIPHNHVSWPFQAFRSRTLDPSSINPSCSLHNTLSDLF